MITSGCDTWPLDAIGVGLDEADGTMVVYFDECNPQELTRRVALFVPNEKSGQTPEKRAETRLWELRATGDSRQ